MPVAIRAATRIQDMDDANVSLGVGVDEYALTYDHDTAKFVLRAPTDLSGYLLKSGGTMTGALNFNYQGVRKLYTNILTVSSAGGADYTTITAAIAAATALTPSTSNRIAIQVLPGSYQEAIWTLPQYVSLLAPSGGVTCVAADGQRGPSFIFAGYQSVENIVFTYSAFTWKLAKITGTGVALVNCHLSSLGQDGGGNDCWTLWFSTSSVFDGFTLRSCVIELKSSGAATPTTAHAIHCASGSSGQSMYLYNCSVYARRLAGTGEYAALYHEGSIGGSTIANSSFVGTTYSIRHAGTSVVVSNCAISGAILNPVIRADDALYAGYSNTATSVTTLSAAAATDKILILKGAASQSANLQEWQDSSANALATIGPTGAVIFRSSTAATDALRNVLTLGANVTDTGVGAAGLGPAILFQAESTTTVDTTQAAIEASWIVATHATRTSRLALKAYDTAGREGIRIDASGSAALLGFYGHAAAAQPAAYTPSNVSADRSFDADTVLVAELADVVGTLIADLQSIGLLA